MKITTFDVKANRDALQKDIQDALNTVALKHGIKFNFKGGNYSSESLTSKWEAVVIPDGPIPVPKIEQELLQVDGIPYGSTLIIKNKTFKVIGYNVNKPKNAIRIECTDGKIYATSVETALRCLQK